MKKSNLICEASYSVDPVLTLPGLSMCTCKFNAGGATVCTKR